MLEPPIYTYEVLEKLAYQAALEFLSGRCQYVGSRGFLSNEVGLVGALLLVNRRRCLRRDNLGSPFMSLSCDTDFAESLSVPLAISLILEERVDRGLGIVSSDLWDLDFFLDRGGRSFLSTVFRDHPPPKTVINTCAKMISRRREKKGPVVPNVQAIRLLQYYFSPKALSLDPGDRLVHFLEAQTNEP